LGIEVASGPQGLFLCQRKYALKIIDDCCPLEAKQGNDSWMGLGECYVILKVA